MDLFTRLPNLWDQIEQLNVDTAESTMSPVRTPVLSPIVIQPSRSPPKVTFVLPPTDITDSSRTNPVPPLSLQQNLSAISPILYSPSVYSPSMDYHDFYTHEYPSQFPVSSAVTPSSHTV